MRCAIGIYVFGFNDYFQETLPDLPETQAYSDAFYSDYCNLIEITNSNIPEISKTLDENSKATVAKATDKYLTQKAKIIEEELRYAVNNYDVNYFNYEYTADLVEDESDGEVHPTAPSSSSSASEIVTTKDGQSVPRNIEAAQKALATCSGKDFLNYEALVRPAAFNENEFEYTEDVYIDSSTTAQMSFSHFDFNYNSNQITIAFTDQYEDFKQDIIDSKESQLGYASSQLKNRISLSYYAVTDKDEIVSNTDGIKTDTADIKKTAAAYIIYDGKNLMVGGANEKIKSYIKENITHCAVKELYIYVNADTNTENTDIYTRLSTAYNTATVYKASSSLAIAAVSFTIAVIFLVILLCLCGKSGESDVYTTAFIDRMPNDLHLVLSFGAITGIAFLLYSLTVIASWTSDVSKIFIMYTPYIGSSLLTAAYLIFSEWIASAARIFKAREKYFGNMLLAKLIILIGKLFKSIYGGIVKFFKTIFYKPKKTKLAVVLIALGYISANIFLAFFIVAYLTVGFNLLSILAISADIFFNFVFLYFVTGYFKNLDTIIDASVSHTVPDFSGASLPYSLNELANSLTNANNELQQAIDRAVRDEQMKTELITNVSHDLKTPLTSLISYSDLLSKCEIEDENAQKYITVINNQSIKLKRLIEDLIEASKVSTGNVTLTKTKLNLNELSMQAIAEFSPEIEQYGNEIIFTQHQNPINIFADGSKTYRILSNLLSNVKKYSAKGTRIYIDIFSDGMYSYFQIKNISSEPLNIRPEALTERFVRGDESRSKEGNGLGLSIAKDLCALQNGKLTIEIDGDLFKATVALPAKNFSE